MLSRLNAFSCVKTVAEAQTQGHVACKLQEAYCKERMPIEDCKADNTSG